MPNVKLHQCAILLLLALPILVVSCGPSEDDIRATVVAEFTQESPKATSTVRPSATPTKTLTPTSRPTRTPLPTQTPTPTPQPGSFENPLPIGEDIAVQVTTSNGNLVMGCIVYEALRGEDARRVAKAELTWPDYEEPISGQEYVAVRLELEFLEYLVPNKVQQIYPGWNLSLRSSEDGNDTYTVNGLDKWAEGYLPLKAEGWVFFLVREGTTQYLYFQPGLLVLEQLGMRSEGVYISLER